jgi:hypothetical protein
MRKNVTSYSLAILFDLISNILFFPLWWYTKGFLKLLSGLKNFLARQEKSLAFSIWLKNIFTPMYGQNDIVGFLISFAVRLVQIIFRGIAMIFWLIIAILIIIFWLLLPFGVFYLIILQIN